MNTLDSAHRHQDYSSVSPRPYGNMQTSHKLTYRREQNELTYSMNMLMLMSHCLGNGRPNKTLVRFLWFLGTGAIYAGKCFLLMVRGDAAESGHVLWTE